MATIPEDQRMRYLQAVGQALRIKLDDPDETRSEEELLKALSSKIEEDIGYKVPEKQLKALDKKISKNNKVTDDVLNYVRASAGSIDTPEQISEEARGMIPAALLSANIEANRIVRGLADLTPFYDGTQDKEEIAEAASTLSQEAPISSIVGQALPYVATGGVGGAALPSLATRLAGSAALGAIEGGIALPTEHHGSRGEGALFGAAAGAVSPLVARGVKRGLDRVGDAFRKAPSPPDYPYPLSAQQFERTPKLDDIIDRKGETGRITKRELRKAIKEQQQLAREGARLYKKSRDALDIARTGQAGDVAETDLALAESSKLHKGRLQKLKKQSEALLEDKEVPMTKGGEYDIPRMSEEQRIGLRAEDSKYVHEQLDKLLPKFKKSRKLPASESLLLKAWERRHSIPGSNPRYLARQLRQAYRPVHKGKLVPNVVDEVPLRRAQLEILRAAGLYPRELAAIEGALSAPLRQSVNIYDDRP